MRFCTAINCLDGRTQIPVINYLKSRYGVEFVDIITEPGVNRILAEGQDLVIVESIRKRISISVERHQSVGLAVAGHHDCAGNPAPREEQEQHIREAVKTLEKMVDNLPVIGLWVDSDWKVSEIS